MIVIYIFVINIGITIKNIYIYCQINWKLFTSYVYSRGKDIRLKLNKA